MYKALSPNPAPKCRPMPQTTKKTTLEKLNLTRVKLATAKDRIGELELELKTGEEGTQVTTHEHTYSKEPDHATDH